MMKRFFRPLFITACSFALFFTSCVSGFFKNEPCSRELTGTPIKNPQQLEKFFLDHNQDISLAKISLMAELYVEEAAVEGINSDVAFVQMCLETGFLRFGNLVTPEMNNFCGLGSTGPGNPGCVFETEQLGVRAHIQHLQAYATTEEVQLKQECVDPRYSWPHKAKFAKTVHDLTKNWAMDPLYGDKLDGLLTELENF